MAEQQKKCPDFKSASWLSEVQRHTAAGFLIEYSNFES